MIKPITIPPLLAINHKRCVLFAADNSSQNTVISRPEPINADAKASIRSEIECKKMHTISLGSRKHHRFKDFADEIV
jgi:hypothetical protein